MTPAQQIADFAASVPEAHRREILLGVRLWTRYVRDHFYELRLASGKSISDPLDTLTLFEEQVEALTARVSAQLTVRQEQPRWNTCPRCGHVHEGEKECGTAMGGGGLCRCELEVSA